MHRIAEITGEEETQRVSGESTGAQLLSPLRCPKELRLVAEHRATRYKTGAVWLTLGSHNNTIRSTAAGTSNPVLSASRASSGVLNTAPGSTCDQLARRHGWSVV